MRPCSSKSSLRRAPAASGERRPVRAGAGSVVVALVFLLALIIGFLALVVDVFALVVLIGFRLLDLALVVDVFALIVLIGFRLLDLVLVVGDLVLVFIGLGHLGLVVVRRLGLIGVFA